MDEILFQKPSYAAEGKWNDPTFDHLFLFLFFFQLKLVRRVILL